MFFSLFYCFHRKKNCWKVFFNLQSFYGQNRRTGTVKWQHGELVTWQLVWYGTVGVGQRVWFSSAPTWFDALMKPETSKSLNQFQVNKPQCQVADSTSGTKTTFVMGNHANPFRFASQSRLVWSHSDRRTRTSGTGKSAQRAIKTNHTWWWCWLMKPC